MFNLTKLKTIFFGIFLLITAPNILLAQTDDEKLYALIATGETEKAKIHINRIIQIQPGSARALFFSALIEKDSDKAVKLYSDLVLRHKSSAYTPEAYYKIAQYYFVKGFYFSARKIFLDIVDNYPDSDIVYRARYAAAKCLFANGKTDSAGIELQDLLADNPSQTLAAIISDDLQSIASENERIAPPIPATYTPPPETRSVLSKTKDFTLQIGAYSLYRNAERQKNYLDSIGYSSEIVRAKVNGRFLYKVYIERFANRAEAENFGEAFKKKYGLPYRIVKYGE